MPTGAGPRRALLLSTPNRITFSPGRDTPLNPFHTRELAAGRAGRAADEAGFVDVAAAGLRHGPRLRALDAAHGGSLVDAQTVAALAGAWPAELLARRRLGDDGGLRPRRPTTSTPASTSSPGRAPAVTEGSGLAVAGRETRRHENGAAASGDVLPRPALPPALARPPRAVAGRRGVALPVVGARLPPRARRRATGSPPRAVATCSPSASPRCWPPSSTTRTASAACTTGSAAGCCAPTAPRGRLPDLAAHEHRAATAALADFETHWRHGASPLLRSLGDAGAVELLGGPATHPFGPLLLPQVRAFALDDRPRRHRAAARRPARKGSGRPSAATPPAWRTATRRRACARFLVDGPALHGDTAFARPVGASDVVAFGRDLDVTYRVWSPRAGYPGGRDYRDFHTYDHPSGLKPARVTGRTVAPHEKRPYDPERAAAAVARDAADFVSVVRERLRRAP